MVSPVNASSSSSSTSPRGPLAGSSHHYSQATAGGISGPLPSSSSSQYAALSPRRPQSSSRSLCSLWAALTHLTVAIVAFNLGYLYHYSASAASGDAALFGDNSLLGTLQTTRSLDQASAATTKASTVSSSTHDNSNNKHSTASSTKTRSALQDSLPLQTVGLFANGMARVKRDDFMQFLPLGVPLDVSRAGNDDVLVLYSNAAALPTATPMSNETTSSTKVPLYSAKDATAKCHSIRLVLQQPKKDRECLVVMGQWESYSIDKYMRLPATTAKRTATSDALPFRHVPRDQRNNGKVSRVPTLRQINDYWDVLTDYLASLDETVDKLRPIANSAAGNGTTIIVMTCNWGQASLLANFVCAARARNLDVSHVLLFATDEETHELAQSLGIHSFFVDQAFGEMPKVAARVYGDKRFASMMMSKVYCVHLINMMGYDLLFQDVDMYWYKNPLDYFLSDHAGDFDMYFQDDGARSARYAPYSPNSGFYFVRNNARTQYFFSVFLRMGDLILASGSHQGALTSVMIEHANWKGLKVKVFGVHQEEGGLFPGGHHYHRDHVYMKHMIKGDGQVDPFIFHMSWTKNKDNKLRFLQQMAYWHLKEECQDKPVNEIDGGAANMFSHCCMAEPVVACHYRDKPSSIPCRDSPNIDAGRRSFW